MSSVNLRKATCQATSFIWPWMGGVFCFILPPAKYSIELLQKDSKHRGEPSHSVHHTWSRHSTSTGRDFVPNFSDFMKTSITLLADSFYVALAWNFGENTEEICLLPSTILTFFFPPDLYFLTHIHTYICLQIYFKVQDKNSRVSFIHTAERKQFVFPKPSPKDRPLNMNSSSCSRF